MWRKNLPPAPAPSRLMKAAQSLAHLCHCPHHHCRRHHQCCIHCRRHHRRHQTDTYHSHSHDSSPLHPEWGPVLGDEAMGSHQPGLLGTVEEEDQVRDEIGFPQDHYSGDLAKTRMRGLLVGVRWKIRDCTTLTKIKESKMHSCSTEDVSNHPSVFIRVYLFYMFLSVSIGFVICFISFICFLSIYICFYLFLPVYTDKHSLPRERKKKLFGFTLLPSPTDKCSELVKLTWEECGGPQRAGLCPCWGKLLRWGRPSTSSSSSSSCLVYTSQSTKGGKIRGEARIKSNYIQFEKYSLRRSQESRMLSPSRHSLFKGHNVIVNIVVLNCQKCNQCLKCQVSGQNSLGSLFEGVL